MIKKSHHPIILITTLCCLLFFSQSIAWARSANEEKTTKTSPRLSPQRSPFPKIEQKNLNMRGMHITSGIVNRIKPMARLSSGFSLPKDLPMLELKNSLRQLNNLKRLQLPINTPGRLDPHSLTMPFRSGMLKKPLAPGLYSFDKSIFRSGLANLGSLKMPRPAALNLNKEGLSGGINLPRLKATQPKRFDFTKIPILAKSRQEKISPPLLKRNENP